MFGAHEPTSGGGADASQQGGGEGCRNAPQRSHASRGSRASNPSDLPTVPTVPTVLIVEDERVARRALASLLDQSGFNTHAHESAEDALRDIEHGCDAKIALVDIDLPGMSGFDLIQRLEEKKPGLVAIVISAAGGERVDRFRRDHQVHYFRKPLDFSRLLGLLETTAAQHPPC